MIAAAIGALVFLIGYMLGSIPTGYLAGRFLGNIDIREHGSHSIGATNVLRTLGRWPAAGVLTVDFLKGFAAVCFAVWMAQWLSVSSLNMQRTAADANIFVALAGLAALLGHSRSIWLGFNGGKSAATGLGVLFAMSTPVGFGTMLAFVATLIVFRIVSASSLVAAFTAVLLVIALGEPTPYRVLVILGAIYVFVLHRKNIHRLFNGHEPQIGKSSPK